MANIEDPLPARLRLLMEAANSSTLYGNEISAKTLEVKKRSDSLVSAQITAVLSIASAYRAVSTIAVIFITGTIYVDLLTAELMYIFRVKSAGNHITGHLREDNDDKTLRIGECGRRNLART